MSRKLELYMPAILAATAGIITTIYVFDPYFKQLKQQQSQVSNNSNSNNSDNNKSIQQ